MTTSLSFERIADRYDETRFGIAERQRIADFLEPWLVPGPAVEVGVGTGLIAGVLRDRGHTVYGVDLSPAMLARAAAYSAARCSADK